MVIEFNEFNLPEPKTVTVQKIDPDVMNQVRDWLARITPRQPPRKGIGSVAPAVTVSFFRFADRQRKTIAERFDVYTFKDSKSEEELLSESEIMELRRIVE